MFENIGDAYVTWRISATRKHRWRTVDMLGVGTGTSYESYACARCIDSELDEVRRYCAVLARDDNITRRTSFRKHGRGITTSSPRRTVTVPRRTLSTSVPQTFLLVQTGVVCYRQRVFARLNAGTDGKDKSFILCTLTCRASELVTIIVVTGMHLC